MLAYLCIVLLSLGIYNMLVKLSTTMLVNKYEHLISSSTFNPWTLHYENLMNIASASTMPKSLS